MSKLHEFVNVNVRFQRATRIDHDLDVKGEFFNGFVFHGTAEHTLSNIAENYSQAKRRAFTVTGPYGSGKSTIALLLAGLLSEHNTQQSAAKNVVGRDFSTFFYEKVGGGKRWFIIKAVCDFEHPISSIWRAIQSEANNKNIDVSSIVAPTDTKSFLFAYRCLSELIKERFHGILILLDEMGKTLDYLNSNDFDLQFYQELADAVERNALTTLFVGFLHQAFSEYAQGRNQGARDSWAKVQGRYTDLLFNVSEDETVTLICSSINRKEYKPATAVVDKILTALDPSSISKKVGIRNKLIGCLPLHPLTAIILGPISKRRFSQNERSTFNFLSSSESHGFQEFLKSKGVDELYRLYHLFDYLEANLDHLISCSPDAKIWTDAKDAVERCQRKYADHVVDLVKTIAILTLFGRKSGLLATEEVIHGALERSYSKESICLDLRKLQDEKIIIYRQYIQSYSIFEGSDVDIDEELLKFRENNLSDEAWQSKLIEHADYVVAKRHYHEYGVLRWMKIIIHPGRLDIVKFEKKNRFNSNEFSAFILLTEDNPEELSKLYPELVFGLANSILGQIKLIISDLLALNYISAHHNLVAQDSVARRELDARRGMLRLELDSLYKKIFSDVKWFSNGNMRQHIALPEISSDLADAIFNKSVSLHNELINRTKLSSAAVAARKKLMVRMVENYHQHNLMIDGYPPEMAMYQSCISSVGLHKDILGFGEYAFVSPEQNTAPKLAALWSDTLEIIKGKCDSIITLDIILNKWTAKPYGVTNGVAPIWLLALLMANLDNIAFYDQDITNKFIYITGPDEEFINKLIREPAKVGVRYFVVDGVKRTHINTLHRILNKNSTTDNTLSVAQEFVKFVSRQTNFVKSTKNLSKEALAFRDLTLTADDPNKFLLEDLPTLFGNNTDDLINDLTRVVDEIKRKHAQEINKFAQDIDSLVGSRNAELIETAKAVQNYSAESGLKTFALRLSEFATIDTTVWASNMVSFLSGTAERNWNDSTFEKAKVELVKFAERFRQASYFAAKLGSDTTQYENADHSIEIGKIDVALEGLSRTEQAVILKKKLEMLIGKL